MGIDLQVPHASPESKDGKNEAEKKIESVNPRVSWARRPGLDQNEQGQREGEVSGIEQACI